MPDAAAQATAADLPPPGATDPFHAGFVALCGRPNVGKSTLLNALVGEAVAVASRLPQTTRERMLGVWNGPGFQAVLVDTPGIHKPRSALNKYMVAEALRGARDVDLVLYLAEIPRLADDAAVLEWAPGPGQKAALESLVQLARPIVLVLTKADVLPRPDLVLPIIERWREAFDFVEIVVTSARDGGGLPALKRVVHDHLPAGDAYFDPDQLSNRDLRWHVRELVRGELFERLGDELPYSCAVTIDRYRELADRDRIHATVHVERESQKPIVIGAGGKIIKAVSMGARPKIERLTGRPCDLFLEVRVSEGWTADPRKLEHLGYGDRDDVGVQRRSATRGGSHEEGST
jgi:GTP-binding protein Era